MSEGIPKKSECSRMPQRNLGTDDFEELSKNHASLGFYLLR